MKFFSAIRGRPFLFRKLGACKYVSMAEAYKKVSGGGVNASSLASLDRKGFDIRINRSVLTSKKALSEFIESRGRDNIIHRGLLEIWLGGKK